MVKVINLKNTEKYKKYNALRKAGYDTKDRSGYLELVSADNLNLDMYIDTSFEDIDKILIALKEELLRVGYKVVG